MQSSSDIWKPPPQSIFKLSFNAAIFLESNSSQFGAIIQNHKGEVMAAMSAKGLSVSSSKEAKLSACRKAMEFATAAGFSELVVEGDNVNVMKPISSSMSDLSLQGNVVEDVHQLIVDLHQLILDLHWINICCARRGGNRVSHVLAQHATNISDDMYWMEDAPLPGMEALY